MMPLGFAIRLISGMMTLAATPPNMVVNSELMRHDIQGSASSASPHGGPHSGMGILYMLVMRTSLVREGEEGKVPDGTQHHADPHP